MRGAARSAGQLLLICNSYKGRSRSCSCRLLAQLTAAHADILDVSSTVHLPLQVRAGICAARLQDMETAMEHFNALLAANPTDFADLYLDVGDLLAETKRFDQVHKPSGTATAIFSSTLRMCHVLLCLDRQMACPVSICMKA